jgi:hypothetical protein
LLFAKKNINVPSNFQLLDPNFKYPYPFPDFPDVEQILVENREIIPETVSGKVGVALFLFVQIFIWVFS